MALLAEEIVEEWLNRQGYFTIRGIKLGVQEIDLLAVRHQSQSINTAECRHIEVQASMRPVSYISRVPKAGQAKGRPANSAKRSQDELEVGVLEWVEKKFRRTEKRTLMESLWGSEWSSELVVNNVKSEEELNLIESHGIRVHRLPAIVSSLATGEFAIKASSGADLVDLIQMGSKIGGNE